MKKRLAFLFASFLWFLGVFLFAPELDVSLLFNDGHEVEVRQAFNEVGHLYLEVHPKEAVAHFTYMTIAGIPVFPRDWVVASVASTVPLGESEIVDFPRFFDLLPKLFLLGRIIIAALPVGLVVLFVLFKYGFPFLKRRCGRRAFLSAALLTALLSLPEPVSDFSPGLDASWSWFLCHFAFENVFGSDVVFTYGPLGFLLYPQATWACVLCALAANAVFVVLWLRLLLRVYSMDLPGRSASWLLVASTMIPMSMEWRWTLLAVLYAAVPVFLKDDDGNGALVEWGAAGVLAAVVSLMKFSSLTIVLGSQAFCIAAVVLRLRKKALRSVIVFGGAFAAVFILFAICCFSSFGALAAWVKGSIATASGYNLYMVSEKSWLELLMPIVIGIGFYVTVGGRHCLLFAPILFLTAKYAWVRQSAGPMVYAVSVLAAICLLDKRNRVRRSVALGVFALLLNVGLALPSALSGLAGLPSIFGMNPMALYHTLTLPSSVEASFKRSSSSVAAFKLPQKWRDQIGSGSVVFLPHEISPAMADSSLNIKPLPSLQLYSACHPYLDELNAGFFEKQMPDFIICGIDANGCGHFINYPRMWKAVLENYKCVDDNGSFAFMVRRACRFHQAAPSVTSSPKISFGEKMTAVFLRNSVEYVNLEIAAGEKRRFQFVRGNQGTAFPLPWIPFDDNDMREILYGASGRVSNIRVLK